MDVLALMAACPGCKDALDSAAARGFAYSIFLMLSLLYGLAGAIVDGIVRMMRRESAAQAKN